MTPPQTCTAKCIEKEHLNSDTLEFTFKLEQDIKWLPGQFILIEVNDNDLPIKRAYSITNTPNNSLLVKLLIKKVKRGRATTWLFNNVHIIL